MRLPDRDPLHNEQDLEQVDGALKSQNEEDKLLKSVLSDDKEAVENGKLLNEAISENVDCLVPDMMYEKLVKDYKIAEQTYGETVIQYVTGYDPAFVRKNVKIPEFQKEIKKNIKDKILRMKESGLLDKDGFLLQKAYKLSSLVLYIEELDHLLAKGLLGEKVHKKSSIHGDISVARRYRKGDRYRDFSVKDSLHTALRRAHSSVEETDLKSVERESKGHIQIIYAIDASASMKGDKIKVAKKAGIALAYKAIQDKDKVGLLIFDDEVSVAVAPSLDFLHLLSEITRIKPKKQTDFQGLFQQAMHLFSSSLSSNDTKHLILITDALPTSGKKPKEDTLAACSQARASGITISVIGIDLDNEGEKLAKEISHIGQGRLYGCHDLETVDSLMLQEYARLSQGSGNN